MRKGESLPTFPDFLAKAIESYYVSDSHFARQAGVSPSAVSRWLAGKAVPTISTLEKIAPKLRAHPTTLIAMAYPGVGGQAADATAAPPAVHPLVHDLQRLLADDSPVPAAERDTLERVVESVIQPYLRHLKGRRRSA